MGGHLLHGDKAPWATSPLLWKQRRLELPKEEFVQVCGRVRENREKNINVSSYGE